LAADTCLKRPSLEEIKNKEPIPWVPLQWVNIHKKPCHAQISIDGHHWSHPFPMSEIAQFSIRINTSIFRVKLWTSNLTLCCAILDELRGNPGYLVWNKTKMPILVSQSHHAGLPSQVSTQDNFQPIRIPPGTSIRFAWDNPVLQKKRRIVSVHDKTLKMVAKLPFDDIGHKAKFSCMFWEEIWKKEVQVECNARISNRGPTRILEISEARCQSRRVNILQPLLWTFQVRIPRVGFSIINNVPEELVYI